MLTNATFEELVDACTNAYDAQFQKFIDEGESETDAQRHAISHSFEFAVETFGIDRAIDSWKAIQSSHTKRKSGILIDPETIKAVTSANQSWNKSSGHAFEQSFCSQLNSRFEGLADPQIAFRIQAEITSAYKKGALGNAKRDLDIIRAWLDSSAFDVYATLKLPDDDSEWVFGCVQCKTSIRDRVTRDREPSLQAMKAFFWSCAIVVDGDFLQLPKFGAMVNGGSADFPLNGWHAMYTYAGCETNDRIIKVGDDFDPLVSDAAKAASDWIKNRQWLDENWGAK